MTKATERMETQGMTFEEFDQTEGQGWRALAKGRDFAGAARAIEAYLSTAGNLEEWQESILHFHAAQMHAYAGATEAALAHLPHTVSEQDEANAYPYCWNDYVAATEAFLRGDRDGLLAARERMTAGLEPGASFPNLRAVDRLIAGFGRPYGEVY